MSRVVVTQNELLDALRADLDAVEEAPPGAMSLADIAAALGIGPSAAKDRLKKLRAAGRIVVHRVRRRSAAGQSYVLPMYSILPARQKK